MKGIFSVCTDTNVCSQRLRGVSRIRVSGGADCCCELVHTQHGLLIGMSSLSCFAGYMQLHVSCHLLSVLAARAQYSSRPYMTKCN